MAPPATEIAYLPLKAGVDLSSPSTPEGTVWQECLATVLGQDGAQRAYWGTEVENPTMLRLFIDWDTMDHHIKFTKSAEYGPFVKHLLSIMDGEPKLFHAEFKPFPPSSALSNTSSPVTELLTLYFKTSISSESQSKFESDLLKVFEAAKPSKGFTGNVIGGWVVESVPLPNDANTHAKAYVVGAGWDSVDAHMAFRESQAFKDNIHLLRNQPDLVHSVGVHYSGLEIQGQGGLAMGADERGAVGGTDAQEEVLNPQGGAGVPPKTRSDGSTSKNVEGVDAANSLHKDRAGRGHNPFGK